ncbi:MAG: hypothetical protein ACI8TX_003996 [Hyphomicrobiaceae bacterium]|jgi:hypothetical protein
MSTPATTITGNGATLLGERRYEVQGQEVRMPVVVRDASSLAATWLVDTERATAMIPGDAFETVELFPGKSILSLALIDYRDNDLGDYNEVSVAFFVRPRGTATGIPYIGTLMDILRSRVSTYICWLPVDQSFTRDAGDGIWGFPKTVDTIDYERVSGRASATLVAEGQKVLRMSGSAAGAQRIPESTMTTYTYIDGQPHATAFTSRSTDCGFRIGGGVELELGDHPFADQLRGLGMSSRPMMSVWMGHMYATFQAPVPL